MRDVIYTDGAWSPSSSNETIEVVNPATEEVIDHIPAGTTEDVQRAVAAAKRALPSWSATPASERAGYLAKAHEALAARQDEIARTIATDVGSPLKIATKVQAGMPIAVMDSYAKLAPDYSFEEQVGNSLVVKDPVGVVGAITPWNYPLHQVVAKVAPALAAGCTVVLKPSEVAPLAAYLLADVFHDAGLPAGVFNLVSGTGPAVGEAIATHPDVDMVSFTGSARAGRRVSELAADTIKRVTLELGGKSPNVLLPDADLESAVKAGVSNAYLNSGQTCTALTRMLVHRDRYDEAVELAKSNAEGFRTGPPLAEGTKLGPLVSQAQRDRVRGYIDQGVAEGARLVTGGSEAPEDQAGGYFVRPTVFADVTPEMTIAREEIFGPVLSILPYDDEEEAAHIANDTVYGLAAAVWSADQDHATQFARRLRAGQVDVNGGRFNPLAPFGGHKQSGVGRELGAYGLEEYLELKSLQL